jgi:hypothetical protein
VYGFGSSRASVEVAVTASGSRAFASHNTPVPDWWSEGASAMTTDLLPVFQVALEQHDKNVEKREKSLHNRLKRIGIGLLWTLAGILLGWILLGWIASFSH